MFDVLTLLFDPDHFVELAEEGGGALNTIAPSRRILQASHAALTK
jgi:hypothetical protein